MKGRIMKKRIPDFKDENEERAFWEAHDTSLFVDWSKAEEVSFPNLKPSLKEISIRLPESLIESYKAMANKRDVPYQSLMKLALAGYLPDERKPKSRAKLVKRVKSRTVGVPSQGSPTPASTPASRSSP
jgi:predicted DNA binding CopG/RHH family protein